MDCAFCPQHTLSDAYIGDTFLTLLNYEHLIRKVPKEVRITFAGFTEPFLNKHCADMIVMAHELGHPVSVFTTGVGMSVEDVNKIKDIPFAGNPNGGFTLHLPDQDRIAKHPLNKNYRETILRLAEVQNEIKEFSTMVMGWVIHDFVSDAFPNSIIPEFYNRAGNLNREFVSKPELNALRERIIHADVKRKGQTCGCDEDLYHNVLLPNGDVSLCCMDYGLNHILGNLYTQNYDDIVPVHNTCFNLCRYCENGVDPKPKIKLIK